MPFRDPANVQVHAEVTERVTLWQDIVAHFYWNTVFPPQLKCDMFKLRIQYTIFQYNSNGSVRCPHQGYFARRQTLRMDPYCLRELQCR